MFLVDTHCHLNNEYYPGGLAQVLRNAFESDVKRLLFASADLQSSREAVDFAAGQTKDPEVWALVGIHPHEALSAGAGIPDELEELALNRRVVAVGEIGLDYFYDHSPHEVQRKVFCDQIELAKKIKKPIVIHVRDSKGSADEDANGETIKILRETGADEIGGVIHCFSGNLQNAEDALKLGFYISFAGPVTYPKNTALRETAMQIPLDRILCETDSPYLAPQGFRGKTNEPCHVRQVYELIAMLKAISVEEFAEVVRKNGDRIFGWGNADV